MRVRVALAVWALFEAGVSVTGIAEEPAPLVRVPNTTLQMPQAPQTFGFRTERVFSALSFTDPVALVTPPGETNRLFIVEQSGRISVITNLANPTKSTFLDIRSRIVYSGEQGLLGLAFHPGYQTNRYFYVFYTLNTTTAAGTGLHDRLSRFEISPDNPDLAVPTSELPLITQRDNAANHNAGDLHFGPDGYLYVSLGDEGDGNDTLLNSQRIDKDFFSAIMRIDVDKRSGNLDPNPHASNTNSAGAFAYRVPADNPFVGITRFNGINLNPARVRTEFWAVGLRNPWRMSFDPATGTLWCADVGQSAREEIDIIIRGGNYGWNYREGKIARPGSPAPPAGFTHVNPIWDYDRTLGVSVTGGVVYRGSALSQLYGAYVYADYGTGRIWALRYDGTRPPTVQQLTVDTGISGFGVDPRNGDILICDHGEDVIKRLTYNTTPSGTPLPPTLDSTGAFLDLASLTPQPGIVPYEINVPFWSDGATKKRWFSVPDVAAQITFNASGNWEFPAGTVWIKHFDLELTNGVPESARRLETRFIVKNPAGVYGVTYRWDDTQQNASLVPENGLDEEFAINDGGITRTQVWHYPSRAECRVCHTPQAGFALGFNTPQLNRDFHYGVTAANQLSALQRAGYLTTDIPKPASLARMAPPADAAAGLTHRARSYLAANCAQCHRPGGPAQGFWDARYEAPTILAGIINGKLNAAHDPDHRVVVPNDPELSELLHRISTRGPGKMPPIASSVVDAGGVALLTEWITNRLASYVPFDETIEAWQLRHFGSASDPRAALDADPDTDGLANLAEYALERNPLDAADAVQLTVAASGGQLSLIFPRFRNHGFEVELEAATDLFSNWRPVQQMEPPPFFSNAGGTGSVLVSSELPAAYFRLTITP